MMHLFSTEPSDLKGYLSLCGGFIMHLVCGALYMWGTLNGYITSYFRLVDPNNPNLSMETGASIFPVMMCCVATGMPLGVRAVKKFRSARLYCYCAGAAATLCVYTSSFVTQFYQFVLIYGVAFGVITGTIYYIPIYMGYLYFPKKKGMVTGVVLMGYGLASLIFGLTFFSLVNPHNLKAEYDDEHLNKYFKGKSESVALEVPKVLRKMSFYYIILYAIGASLIFYHPNQAGEEERRLKEALIEQSYQLKNGQPDKAKEKELKEKLINNILQDDDDVNIMQDEFCEKKDIEYIEMQEITKSQNQTKSNNFMNQLNSAYNQSQAKYQNQHTNQNTGACASKDAKKDDHGGYGHYPLPCPRPKIAFRTQQFYVSMLVGILSLGLGLCINGNYKSIGKSEFPDDAFLTICGAFAAVANGFSRPLWSSLLDKYSFRNIFSKLLCFEIFLAFSFRLAFIHKFVYLVYVFMCHTTFGGIMAMFPVLSGQLFGTKVSSLLYGVYWYGFGISNFIQFFLVFNFQKKYGFETIIYIDGVFAILCLLIIRFYNLKTDWSKYYNQAGELIKK